MTANEQQALEEQAAKVNSFVHSLREMFKDRAKEVAERQLQHAEGEARVIWKAVVNALTERSDQPERP